VYARPVADSGVDVSPETRAPLTSTVPAFVQTPGLWKLNVPRNCTNGEASIPSDVS
jgi:hypothetical protein